MSSRGFQTFCFVLLMSISHLLQELELFKILTYLHLKELIMYKYNNLGISTIYLII